MCTASTAQAHRCVRPVHVVLNCHGVMSLQCTAVYPCVLPLPPSRVLPPTKAIVYCCHGRACRCEVVTGSSGQVLWAGLTVRMGMAYGFVNLKKPVHTGAVCGDVCTRVR